MIIQKNCVVAFDYTLTDNEGTVIDTSLNREPLVYLHGVKAIIPGMEKALDGRSAGDKFKTTLAPEDAYGQRDEALMHRIPHAELKHIEGLQEGSQIQAESEGGGRTIYSVILIKDGEVTLDGNHPLAGITLNFDMDVKSVRAASDEEIEHGHVHGPGGHHHHH